MKMQIRKAVEKDISIIAAHDRWIGKEELARKIDTGRLFVIFEADTFVGWIRYGLFWDNTPFLKMLHLLEPFRGRGNGTKALQFWESEMRKLGYRLVMTSTAQTEYAQHFYVNNGYKAAGSFQMANEPLEILFLKNI